jgi:hypothetical protein
MAIPEKNRPAEIAVMTVVLFIVTTALTITEYQCE